MSSFYTISPLDHIASKLSKFKYRSCGLFREKAAFGTPSGSVHIYSVVDQSPPVVISFPQIVSSINIVSFSPSGKWVAICDEKFVHLIEDPFQTPSLSLSVDLKGHKSTSLLWIADPPQKMSRSPFLACGDNQGGFWIIRHQSGECVVSASSSIVQIAQVGDSFLLTTQVGAFFVTNNQLTPIRGKRPQGDFGAVFAEGYDVICFARPEGKLLLATPQGKSKAIMSLIDPDHPPAIPQDVSTSLAKLAFRPPFLLSLGTGCACFIINLLKGTLSELRPEFSDLIDFSEDQSSVLILGKDRVSIFKVCQTAEEYFSYLISEKSFEKAQSLAVETGETDKELLSKMNVNPSPAFTEYLHVLELRSQPRPLSDVNPELMAAMKVDVPDSKTMEALLSIRSCIVVDDYVAKKVTNYVVENPSEWGKWKDVVSPDIIVALLNNKQQNAALVAEIAKFGKSELCQWISSIDKLSTSFCVANSPPIQVYNLPESRRSEFLSMEAEVNPFISKISDAEKIVDSYYEEEMAKIDLNALSHEEGQRLLRICKWERELAQSVKDVQAQTELYMLCMETKSVPEWVEACMEREGRGQDISDVKKDGNGNWGVEIKAQICPICGMPLSIGESISSVTVFPCSHAFHVSCLHSRFCPICFIQSVE